MKTWQAQLHDEDPARHESALAADQIDRMRRAVLAVEPRAPSRTWTRRLTVVSAVGLLVAAAWLQRTATTARPLPPQPRVNDRAQAPGIDAGRRRQLQFSTPGGTRVIWVFDSDFNTR